MSTGTGKAAPGTHAENKVHQTSILSRVTPQNSSVPSSSLKLHFRMCRWEGEKENFSLAWDHCYQTTVNKVYWSINSNHQCHFFPTFM